MSTTAPAGEPSASHAADQPSFEAVGLSVTVDRENSMQLVNQATAGRPSLFVDAFTVLQ